MEGVTYLSQENNEKNSVDLDSTEFQEAFEVYEEELLNLCDDIEAKLGENPSLVSIGSTQVDFSAKLNSYREKCIQEVNDKYDEVLARIQAEREETLKKVQKSFNDADKSLMEMSVSYQSFSNFQEIRDRVLDSAKETLARGETREPISLLKRMQKLAKDANENLSLLSGDDFGSSIVVELQPNFKGGIFNYNFESGILAEDHPNLYQVAMNAKKIVRHDFKGEKEDLIIDGLGPGVSLLNASLGRFGEMLFLCYDGGEAKTLKIDEDGDSIKDLGALPAGWGRGKMSVCFVDRNRVLLAGGYNIMSEWDQRCAYFNPTTGFLEEFTKLPSEKPAKVAYERVGKGGLIYSVGVTQTSRELTYSVEVYNDGVEQSVVFPLKSWTTIQLTLPLTKRLAQKFTIVPTGNSKLTIFWPNVDTADVLDLQKSGIERVKTKQPMLWNQNLLVHHQEGSIYLTSDTKEDVFVYNTDSHLVTAHDMLKVKAFAEIKRSR